MKSLPLDPVSGGASVEGPASLAARESKDLDKVFPSAPADASGLLEHVKKELTRIERDGADADAMPRRTARQRLGLDP